jgi:hypothetical protein
MNRLDMERFLDFGVWRNEQMEENDSWDGGENDETWYRVCQSKNRNI